MIFKYQEKLTGIRFAAPAANIFKFHGEPGTLTDLDIWVDFAAASGDNVFNLLINGVAQFVGAARPKIVAGALHAVKTGLSISIADGDIISIDLQSAAASGLTLPAYFRASIETGKGDIEALMFAISDETTDITTGAGKLTVRMPYAFKLATTAADGFEGVRTNVNTVSSSGAVQVDINEAGGTILSTKLTIDAGEKTSQTAATPPVISDANLTDDAEITFDIDSSGTGAKGLKVTLIGRRQ